MKVPVLYKPKQDDEYCTVFERGVRLLAVREHSVKELVAKLSSNTESIDLVHAVIDELLARRLLSEERFTECYVRSRVNKGFGPSKILTELEARGISESLIHDYLNPDAEIWFDIAETQYRKKFGEREITDRSVWNRQARFLQNRGFTMEQIQSAIPELQTF